MLPNRREDGCSDQGPLLSVVCLEEKVLLQCLFSQNQYLMSPMPSTSVPDEIPQSWRNELGLTYPPIKSVGSDVITSAALVSQMTVKKLFSFVCPEKTQGSLWKY